MSLMGTAFLAAIECIAFCLAPGRPQIAAGDHAFQYFAKRVATTRS